MIEGVDDLPSLVNGPGRGEADLRVMLHAQLPLRLDHVVLAQPLAGAARHFLCREFGEVGDHPARDAERIQTLA